MIIDSKTIDLIDPDFIKMNEEITIQNSIIELLDLSSLEFNNKITISHCHIREIRLRSTWFLKGFELVNCIIRDKIQFEMGGHNRKPIRIEGNVFMNLFVFFDCWFMSDVNVINNIFIKGCTLRNTYNTFDCKLNCTGNIGDMDVLQMD